MFRASGSTMSAVSIVNAMYDGPIPADVMTAAVSEDERFASEQQQVEGELLASHKAIAQAQISYCRSMVVAKVTDARQAQNERDLQSFRSGVRHWLKKYRAEQAILKSLCQGEA